MRKLLLAGLVGPLVCGLLHPAILPAAIPSEEPAVLSGHLRPEDVFLQPGPQLYSGDIVSLALDVDAAPAEWGHALVSVYHGTAAGEPLAQARLASLDAGGEAQTTFVWAWDTHGLEGPQTLVFSVTPDLPAAPTDMVTITVDLLPADRRPMPEPLAQWAETSNVCCRLHYLTGTAAARDLELIRLEIDRAFAHVESTLGITLEKRIDLTILSRLIGHGGFAGQEAAITYIDRNPIGSRLREIATHEAVHMLDPLLAARKPTIMAEGLAVYVTGGHLKPEALEDRAAALIKLGLYLPLRTLANDFYAAQHDIGYLEAGAFVQYLVERNGWKRFKAFYASFPEAASDGEMLDQALQRNYGQGIEQVEVDWLAHLHGRTPSQAQLDDVRLTIALYDTLRRYQKLEDPAAHFITAWLPDTAEARRRGIVADFIRHPNAPANIALETMLQDAARALADGDYAKTEMLVAAVNGVLDSGNDFSTLPAADYFALVNEFDAEGYEVQTISMNGDEAIVTVIRDWPLLETFSLHRTAAGWISR